MFFVGDLQSNSLPGNTLGELINDDMQLGKEALVLL